MMFLCRHTVTLVQGENYLAKQLVQLLSDWDFLQILMTVTLLLLSVMLKIYILNSIFKKNLNVVDAYLVCAYVLYQLSSSCKTFVFDVLFVRSIRDKTHKLSLTNLDWALEIN